MIYPDGERKGEYSTYSSEDFVRGLQRMEPWAWERLARLYGPVVYRWCRLRGVQSGDAEDLTQEVFVTVAERISEFRLDGKRSSLRGWLWVIARNKIGDWLRRQNNHEQPDGGSDARMRMEQIEADADDDSAVADVGDLYQRALDMIRGEFEEKSWQAFWLVTMEDRSADQAAEQLGMTRNAVYIARSRVLRRLRDLLGEP